MTVLMSGINMYSMALVMKIILGWDINFSIWVSSFTVAAYVLLGGLLSAIFNEVLQFFLIWLGAILISILGFVEAGGWSGMVARIHHNFPGQNYTHLWSTLGSFTDNPMGIHWTGIVLGLGFVISFGYWTTDFLVVQRVLAAKDLRSAKMAPDHRRRVQDGGSVYRDSARACWPSRCCPNIWSAEAQALATGAHSYNEVLPLMLARYCGPGLAGPGNHGTDCRIHVRHGGQRQRVRHRLDVRHLSRRDRKDATDGHYVIDGPLVHRSRRPGQHRHRLSGDAVPQHHGLCAGAVQFLHRAAVRNRPAGMLWKRATPAGGFWGLLAAPFPPSACGLWVKVDPTALRYIAISPYAKDMAENMYRALWSWIICVIVTVVVSMATRPKPVEELVGLVYGATEIPSEGALADSTAGPSSGPLSCRLSSSR